ncbi:MAG: hypothetical protein ACLSA6_04230 [Holdemania massiliensis]
MIAIFTPLITWVRQKLIEIGITAEWADHFTQDQLNNIRDAVFDLERYRHRCADSIIVKVTTPLAITIGDASQTIQSILDGILQALLCRRSCHLFWADEGQRHEYGQDGWIMIVATILLSYFGILA